MPSSLRQPRRSAITRLRAMALQAGLLEPVGDLPDTRVGCTVAGERGDFCRIAERDQRGADRVGLGRCGEGQEGQS